MFSNKKEETKSQLSTSPSIVASNSSPSKNSKQRNNDIIFENVDEEEEETKFIDAIHEISKKFECQHEEVYMLKKDERPVQFELVTFNDNFQI